MVRAKRPAAPKADTSNKPWVSNYPPLQAWLDRHGARCLWQQAMGEPPRDPDEAYDWTPQAFIEGWQVGKGVVILVVYANKRGWEIFSAPMTNSVAMSLADAERRCGISAAPCHSGAPRTPANTCPTCGFGLDSAAAVLP